MWANLLPFAAMIELRLRSIKLLGMRMGPKWLTMKCWGNKQRFDIVLMVFWATASNIFNEDKLLAPVFNRSSRHPEGRGSCERLLLCTPRRVCGKMAQEYIKLQQSLLFGSFEQQQGLMFRLGTFAVYSICQTSDWCTAIVLMAPAISTYTANQLGSQLLGFRTWWRPWLQQPEMQAQG